MRWRRWALGLGAAAIAAAAVAAIGEETVRREGARLMKGPRFFGEACREEVRPGQKVQVSQRHGKWALLASPGNGKCWLHASAWMDRKASGGAGATRTSQQDVELAGRGFSEGHERKYRADHPALEAGYRTVDQYIQQAPETGPEDLRRFAAEGKLGGMP